MIRISRTRALLAAAALGATAAMACPAPALAAGTQDMWRLYNPNSGEHFYTANTAERDHLASLGWRLEGKGWTAPSSSNTPVYRLYNPNAGDHHYTSSASERDWLVSLGWSYEGIGWYSDDAHGVPLYRQYNPNAAAGSHNYTTSKSENDHLASVGWRAEGIGWYGVGATKVATSGTGGSGWTAPESSYTLYYDGNGATGGSTPESGMARASANGFVKSTPHGDAPFLGWNTRRDGSGTWVQPGHAAPSGGTLYAQWDTWVDTSTGSWDETVTDRAAWDEEVANGAAVKEPLVDYGYYQVGDNVALRDGSRAKVELGGQVEFIRSGYVIVQANDKADAEAAAAAYKRQGTFPWMGGSWDNGTDVPIKSVTAYSYDELYDIGLKYMMGAFSPDAPLYYENQPYTDYGSWSAAVIAREGNDGLRQNLIITGRDEVRTDIELKGEGDFTNYQDVRWFWKITQPTKTVHHSAVTHIVHHEGQTSGHWKTQN